MAVIESMGGWHRDEVETQFMAVLQMLEEAQIVGAGEVRERKLAIALSLVRKAERTIAMLCEYAHDEVRYLREMER